MGYFLFTRKRNIKNATGVDTSHFAKKDDLDNLKSDINKLDIEKFQKGTKQFKLLKK